jgi:zona occludens toxin (predicted ATPase)
MAIKHVCAALVFAAATLSPAAVAEAFRVKADETVTLKLTSAADSVVVGNATVADVAVHDPMTLLVTGKAFGSTNILVLDHAGRTIYQNDVVVTGSTAGQVTIVRGAGTYTYSCVDKCRATPAVGDAPGHFQDLMQTVQGMNAAAKGQGQ